MFVGTRSENATVRNLKEPTTRNYPFVFAVIMFESCPISKKGGLF